MKQNVEASLNHFARKTSVKTENSEENEKCRSPIEKLLTKSHERFSEVAKRNQKYLPVFAEKADFSKT